MVKRCTDVNRRINPNMEDDANAIRSEIKEIIDKWEDLAENAEEGFWYGKKFMVNGPDGPGNGF